MLNQRFFVCSGQVLTQFDSEEPDDVGKEKRTAANSLTVPGSKGVVLRQRAWIGRHEKDRHPNSWRPRPVNRAEAKRVGSAFDLQV